MSLIREVKHKKQRPFWQVVLIIFIAIIIINSLITLTNKLEDYTGIDANISSLIILFLSILVCAFIILKLLSYYAYSFVDESIIFERIIGKRVDYLLRVNLKELLFIKPYNKKELKKVYHTYKYYYYNDKEGLYYGEFDRNGKRYRIVFKPSERMLRILSSKIN